ncbi:hypothetical protein K504DRAFT_409005 [Pleomassaria siparia CBS 279.74]|uniref:GH16 domain-containing protein n=1 Tax=Pleomassaria siparia CBS 279.74 TaxID=1314801 RepID=A0A6G1K5X6_9PLEO|nr:hypothetical protein K504DRAFT_409005 [Pleomassaria siparia CBS 279.74]
MVRRALSAIFALATLATTILADSAKCGPGNLCPKETPCCGQYGDCGVGAFCLGGCDPLFSATLDSCVPNPTCKGGDYSLDSLDDVQDISLYLGDASKINWQSQGKTVAYPPKDPNSLLLTMAEGTVGSLLASTHYVWYGKICATMTTSQGKGVVTAFIMMSDVRDEIDFEWIGVDINNAQSNYYSQGVTVYTNANNLTVSPNTVEKLHEYCIDWKPDALTWSVDGKDMRTVQKKETWNSTSNRFDYPQTPSRIMLSLWPAGLATNGKGTIDWAGGVIDWNSKYMQNGYYFARVQSITVDCYDPPSGAKINGKKSYKYTGTAGTNDTIQITDDLVVLGSLMGTGENPGEAPKSDAPEPTATVAMVPGGNPGGGGRQETPASVALSAGQTSAGGDTTQINPTAGANSGTFVQGTTNPSTGASMQPGLGKISGSALAIVLAVLGLCVL